MVMKVIAATCIIEFSKVFIVDTSFPLQARLQQVNRAWRDCVGNTLEWAALDMVRVDTPGSVRYLLIHNKVQPSL